MTARPPMGVEQQMRLAGPPLPCMLLPQLCLPHAPIEQKPFACHLGHQAPVPCVLPPALACQT